MSATIGINDLKFVIFASGHDYTLADSGDGDVQIFSHPFVPKGSKNYAGQYYFLVPDEDGNPLDAVKDDIAHCTFTPAIGSTFSTVGDVTVECHYHREYIHDEETIIVDKTVKQIITVVNHGSKSTTRTYCDLYSDGYLFFRPSVVNTAQAEPMYSGIVGQAKLNATKISSIPWRTTDLGQGINNYGAPLVADLGNLADISELEFADTSNCVSINIFDGGSFDNLEPLRGWDTSKAKFIVIGRNCAFTDISAVAGWDTSSCEDMSYLTSNCDIISLHGVENWDVSKVKSLASAHYNCTSLTDISAVANWKTESLENLEAYLDGCISLTTLHGVENWNLPKLQNLHRAFARMSSLLSLEPLLAWVTPLLDTVQQAFTYCISLVNYHGVENLDVSNVTDYRECFRGNEKCTDISAVTSWNTGNGELFNLMFAENYWIPTIDPIAGWNFTSASDLSGMCHDCNNLTSVDDTAFNFAGKTITEMFHTVVMYWSSLASVKVWSDGSHTYDYNGEVDYPVSDLDHPLQPITKDASDASNWSRTGTGLNVFSSDWSNRPSWN